MERPRPSSGIRAVPMVVLMRSAVDSPIRMFCWRRRNAMIASSILSPPTRIERA